MGKTTLIGALVSESRDDGRGSLRFSTSKLVHEVLNGGTTCAATPHILDHADNSYLVELLDLPAFRGKYRKTLFKALVTKPIDLIVTVHDEDTSATCLDWVKSLDIPIIEVASKADVSVCCGQERLRVSTVTGQGLDTLKTRIVTALKQRQAAGIELQKTDEELVVVSVDESWTKDDMLVVGGVLESGILQTGMTLRLQNSRFSEMCKVKDIRGEAGTKLKEFACVGRYCTLGIVKLPNQVSEEISTAASSSGEFLKPTTTSQLRPPLMLTNELLPFVDSATVHLQTSARSSPSLKEGLCMVYWRGNRQEARLHRSTVDDDHSDLWTIELRKPAFFAANVKIIIETTAGASVHVGSSTSSH